MPGMVASETILPDYIAAAIPVQGETGWVGPIQCSFHRYTAPCQDQSLLNHIAYAVHDILISAIDKEWSMLP
ncbi:MAG: hypothetical protein KQI35_16525 [Bacteroidetes bacterium]|nr:hypothetical protein [Bacteroidota bacterium]